MTESTFLSGKVFKRSLPVVQPPSSDNPPLKRLLLPQGELAQFYDADQPIRYLAYIELQAASVRGNHYHKVKEEWIYLIQGAVLLLVEDIESKAKASVALEAGDIAFILPGIAHALQTVQPGHAIEFSQARFDLADIHRFALA